MTDPQDTTDGLFEDRLAAEIARFGDRFSIVPVAQVIVQWHQSRLVPMPADADLTSTSEQLEPSQASPHPRSRRGRGGGSGSGAGAAQPRKGRRQIFVGQLRPSADAVALPAAVEHILQAPRSVDSCDMIAGKNGSRYGFLNFRTDEHIEALLQLNRHVYITGASLIFALPPARIPGDKTLQNIVRLVQRSIAGLDTNRNPANTVVFDGARFGADVGGDDAQQSRHSAAPPPAYMAPAAQAVPGMPHHHHHHHHRPPAPLPMQGSAPLPGAGGGFPPAPFHAPPMQGFGVPPLLQPWGQPLVDCNGTPLYPHHYPQLHAQHQHLFAPHNVESTWGHCHHPAPFFHHPQHSHYQQQQQQQQQQEQAAMAQAAAAAALAAPPALVPTPVVRLQPPPTAPMAPQYPHQQHQRHDPQHRRPTPPPTADRQ